MHPLRRTLEIIAVILDFKVTRQFLAAIGAEPQQPEPLAHSPPQHELIYESC